MPNHITTLVRMHCSDERLAEIKAAHCVEAEDEHLFCFETLIPMPESLHVEASFGLIALAKGVRLLAQEEPTTPEEEAMLKVLKDNIAKHGHPTWHDWRIEHWGTKWDSYDCEFDGSLLRFKTAWSHPVPVMRELFRRYPDVVFEVQYADEDVGNNMGFYTSIIDEAVCEHKPRSVGIAAKIIGRDIREMRKEHERDGSRWLPAGGWDIAIAAYDAHELP